jgi:hypothetical protein
MPGWRRNSPLKRWRYLGVYTPELMLCVGEARVGPLPQHWWALAWPDGRLVERTTIRRSGVSMAPARVQVHSGDVRIDLALAEPAAVEVISPTRAGYAWTAKRAPVGVTGAVTIGTERHDIDGRVGFVDDSAGYHDRRTSWRWSAGIGRARSGEAVAWNLVEGIHDDPSVSERTVWVDGEPRELGPNSFVDDLSGVEFAEGGRLAFEEWSAREATTDLLLVRSRYRQPFGTFSGQLPGGLELAEGHGVMEDHDALW